MTLLLEPQHLPLLTTGMSVFGSGGGGSPAILETLLRHNARFPIEIAELNDLPADTPCMTPILVGSTMLFSEKLMPLDAFAGVVETVERWLGHRVPTVCSFEGGGMNGLTPLVFAHDRIIVDADCSGRAFPALDQYSLFVEGVRGLVVAVELGAGGVALIETDRPADVETMVRAAVIQAGGVAPAIIAGFTLGDLRGRSIEGHLARALQVGKAFYDGNPGSIDEIAELVTGVVTAVHQETPDQFVSSIQLDCDDGATVRLIARSEFLSLVRDGRVTATSPDCLVAIDAQSGEVLHLSEVIVNRRVTIFALPADAWWYEKPHRLRRVVPSEYGIHGLDVIS